MEELEAESGVEEEVETCTGCDYLLEECCCAEDPDDEIEEEN